ncbi:MAG TPA: hypothetical protein H9837_08890 [Candidatus Brachybacterium merdigallinarum]|nr:hypothetical protein [Candidatus Brachybacterium merdigallinarum]
MRQTQRALFTGDRAGQFARLAKRYDMEFRDDCLFLYSRRDASTCRPAQWREQLDDVRELAHESPTWPIWEYIRARQRSWLSSLPSMRMRTSPRLLVVAIGVVIIVLVATFGLAALRAWIEGG